MSRHVALPPKHAYLTDVEASRAFLLQLMAMAAKIHPVIAPKPRCLARFATSEHHLGLNQEQFYTVQECFSVPVTRWTSNNITHICLLPPVFHLVDGSLEDLFQVIHPN